MASSSRDRTAPAPWIGAPVALGLAALAHALLIAIGAWWIWFMPQDVPGELLAAGALPLLALTVLGLGMASTQGRRARRARRRSTRSRHDPDPAG